MDIFGGIITFLLLDVIVFVHELGHFVLAKLNKIGVDVFSIGFGKEIFGFQIGETRYRLSLIPFGGYCKMRGEETKDRGDGKEDPAAMYNRPPFARLLAVLGGVMFNFLFAIIAMTLLNFAGYKETLISSDIAVSRYETGTNTTPAWDSGLRSGDRIITISGKNIESFNDIYEMVALNKDEKLTLTYIRGTTTNEMFITPRYSEQSGMGFVGVTPLYLSKVGVVKTNSPAFAAGLKTGDEITAINGIPITYFYQLQEILQDKANQKVSFTVSRSNETTVKEITLDRFEGKGYLGISPGGVVSFEKMHKAKDMIDAIKIGTGESFNFIQKFIDGLRALIQGKLDVMRNLAGTVRIVQFTYEVVKYSDLVGIIQFMALISMAIGFSQLIPFPGFDGGHVLINLFELVTRYKLPEKVRFYIEYAGLMIIISLSVLLLFNDIANIWMGR